MNNPLKTNNNIGDKLADTVSKVSQQSARNVSEGSKAAIDKGLSAAQQVKHSRPVKYARENPVKTAGLVAAIGFVAYSIFGRKRVNSKN